MKLTNIAERLVRAQLKRPILFLGVGLVVTLVMGLLASNLRLESSYEALLPAGSAEVQNADEVRARTGGTRKLVVAIEGDDPQARHAFGGELAHRLEAVDGVRRVEFEIPAGFLRDRAVWLLDDETFEEVSTSVLHAAKLAREQDDPRGLPLAFGRVRDALEGSQGAVVSSDGVLESRDGRYSFLIVVPSISLLDYGVVQELVGEIDHVVEELEPAAAGVEVRYAGNVQVGLEQQHMMVRDLRNAAIVALLLGVLVVAIYTRSLIAPLVIGASLIAGVIWTFAISWLIFGHLNVITGFLVAVLIGLGIDFGIHLFVRYRQELCAEEPTVDGAILRTVTGTLRPAVTGALTTAGTFLTFCFAAFRGFSEFGLIAAIGVVLTLVSSFVLLPPLLVVAAKFISSKPRAPKVTTSPRMQGFRLVAPYAVVGLFAVAAVFGAAHVIDVPYRNDFRRMGGESEATEFMEYVDSNMGGGFNPAVVIVDSVEEVAQVEAIVADRNERIAAGAEGVQIRRILSINDLMPHDVEGRTKRIEDMSRALSDPAIASLVRDDEEMTALLTVGESVLSSRPWTMEEVPEAFRRRFVTQDGSQLIVYLWPEELVSSDAQALAWESELSELQSRFDGAGVATLVVDETLIHAWVHRTVSRDGLMLLQLASVVVFILLFIDVKSYRKALLLASPLVVGVLLLVAAIELLGLELNLFNIIVLPCVIGIGIDNVVHLYHRYRREGLGSVSLVVRRTGAAALLTSLTTCVGFGSSLISNHLGLRSMGTLAIFAISATMLSSLVLFPCVLVVLERLRSSAGHTKHRTHEPLHTLVGAHRDAGSL